MSQSATIPTLRDPADQAEEAVRDVLRTQWHREPAVVVDSPPGAGKTWLVERLAAQSYAMLKVRCMIVAQTNRQALDLTRRIATSFSSVPVTIFAKKGLAIPCSVSGLPNVTVIHRTRDLPDGPCVVIANAWKWASVRPPYPEFDSQIIDEAYQLPDHRFVQIAGLAHRYVLVGDPGQIGAVISCSVERWRDSPTGPHVSCPDVILARFADLRRITLPVSRRLPPGTTAIIQPAFYPELPFTSLSRPDERALEALDSDGSSRIGRAIDLATQGATLVHVKLPARICGEVDEELALEMVQMCTRLVGGNVRIRDGKTVAVIKPEMVGIVCAHVSQVNAVRERLPASIPEVMVETADRFQGLERSVMIAHHPLSGRSNLSEFHLDAGRLCVMLSRHRVTCFLFARAGIKDRLRIHVPSSDRILGVDRDDEFIGWTAHQKLISTLESQGLSTT